MLFIGILFGPYLFNLMNPELLKISTDLRMIALIVILLRAGLELRRGTLNRVGKTAIVLACVPAIFEGAVIAVLAPWLLGITQIEGAILGAIIAAVSPAVVVPFMIDFISQKRGTKKGIPTLILSASALDDVFVIVIFTILLGMATGSDESVMGRLFDIPESIVLGIAIGAAVGFIIFRLFEKYSMRATKMTMVIIAVAILLTWVEENLKDYLAISALLGVMTVGFVILEKSELRAHKISAKLAKVWLFAEILLFVLVGAQVDINLALEAGMAGAVLITVGLFARSVGTYLSLIGTDLNSKEKLFCIIAYIPKATVQAAIGAVPFEAGIPGGGVILAVAVLSILITAPLGAIGIMVAGPRLLAKEK